MLWLVYVGVQCTSNFTHMCVLSLVCSDLNAKICRKAQPGSSVITKQLANHSKRADEHSS